MKDESTKFRRLIWTTALGVRAKLTLIALWEVGDVSDGSLFLPANVFQRISPMIGRKLSSVVKSVDHLSSLKILSIKPTADGYCVHFYPENEIRHNFPKKGVIGK
jgi:hypothetical protein